MNKILILNGPNLNMLGLREPDIYGDLTLDDVKGQCYERAGILGLSLNFKQSNHEGVLVDWIQEARGETKGLIINAGAYTHTSLAIHDALKCLDIPIIEIHITDPETREEFRHFSYIAPLANAIIKGQGTDGYLQALDKLASLL